MNAHSACSGFHRRAFLADLGMGFTGLALGAMLAQDGMTRAAATPRGRPKAKSVIWLFMNGGISHMESFDPKPMLDKYAGKTIAETPYKSVQDPDKAQTRSRCCCQRCQRATTQSHLAYTNRLQKTRSGWCGGQ
jgi:hypothetical protein